MRAVRQALDGHGFDAALGGSRRDEERSRAKRLGITNFDRIYKLNELAGGDLVFAATGVTDGSMVRGVRRVGNSILTSSLVMRSKTGTVRLVGTQRETIVRETRTVLEYLAIGETFAGRSNPYGDGRASARIVAALMGQPFNEFNPDGPGRTSVGAAVREPLLR